MMLKFSRRFFLQVFACASFSASVVYAQVPPSFSVGAGSQIAQSAEYTQGKKALEKEKEKKKTFSELTYPEKVDVLTKLSKMVHRLSVLSRELPTPSVATPNAYGNRGTTLFASTNYANHWSGTDTSDGNMSLGLAFGDPRKYVGAVVSWNNDTLGFRNESFAQNGAFGVRLNRYVADFTAVAAGASTVQGWGAFASDAKSYYFDVTQGVPLRHFPLSFNAGIGSGTFYSASNSANGIDSQFKPFLGMGVLLYKGLSLSTDWIADQYNLGLSYAFHLWIPMFASASYMNMSGKGGSSYWMLGYGVAYTLDS